MNADSDSKIEEGVAAAEVPVGANVAPSELAAKTPPTAAQRSRSFRGFALIFGLIPLALLGITTRLSPASEGLGTHHQLGLPPCSARVMFGVRCPACGMTTSWAHFVRGHWLASPRANVGGFLLAFYALAFSAASLWSAKQGRMPSDQSQQWFVLALLAVAGTTLVDWGFRLGWGV